MGVEQLENELNAQVGHREQHIQTLQADLEKCKGNLEKERIPPHRIPRHRCYTSP